MAPSDSAGLRVRRGRWRASFGWRTVVMPRGQIWGWERPGAIDPGGLGDEEIGDVGLVGTPRSARDGESGVGVELAGRGVEMQPAVPARLEFHEFHRDLYARLRRDAHLDDEAAQTVVNHVAMMGSSPRRDREGRGRVGRVGGAWAGAGEALRGARAAAAGGG